MSAGQVGEGRTTGEKPADTQGKDLPGPETLEGGGGNKEWRRGGGMGGEGDTKHGVNDKLRSRSA